MKILTFTLTSLFLNVALFSQQIVPTEKLDVDRLGLMKVRAFELPIKKDANPYITKPDSIIISRDSLGLSPYNKRYYSYDNNKVSVHYMKIKDGTTDVWENVSLSEYFFGEDTLDLPYEYYLNPIIDRNGITGRYYRYMYSIGDTMSIYQEWDTTSKEWMKKYKVRHTTINSGICEESKIYNWNTANEEYIYNCSVIQELYKQGPDSLGFSTIHEDSVLAYASYVFNYNAQGQINHAEEFQVTSEAEDSMLYNDNGLVSVEYTRIFHSFYYLMRVNTYDEYDRVTKTHIFYHDSATGPWKYDVTFLYYYSYIPPSSVRDIKEDIDNYSVYPNPATDYLNIKGYEGSITLTNITGQTVLKRIVVENDKIYIGNLEKGCYILNYDNGRYSKIIKE